MRFDDWFRPSRRDGSPMPRRERDGRDRLWSLVTLLTMLAAIGFYVATVHPVSDALRRAFFPIGLSLVQVVFLVRTRHLGWQRARRAGLADTTTSDTAA